MCDDGVEMDREAGEDAESSLERFVVGAVWVMLRVYVFPFLAIGYLLTVSAILVCRAVFLLESLVRGPELQFGSLSSRAVALDRPNGLGK
jgi:hypothetical protein